MRSHDPKDNVLTVPDGVDPLAFAQTFFAKALYSIVVSAGSSVRASVLEDVCKEVIKDHLLRNGEWPNFTGFDDVFSFASDASHTAHYNLAGGPTLCPYAHFVGFSIDMSEAVESLRKQYKCDVPEYTDQELADDPELVEEVERDVLYNKKIDEITCVSEFEDYWNENCAGPDFFERHEIVDGKVKVEGRFSIPNLELIIGQTDFAIIDSWDGYYVVDWDEEAEGVVSSYGTIKAKSFSEAISILAVMMKDRGIVPDNA